MIRLSREQVRRVDRICIDEYGLPGIVLMENAAREAANSIDYMARDYGYIGGERATATLVCGGGNNGGDGFAIARRLANLGWRVTIVAIKPIESLKGDAAIMARVAVRMSLPVADDLGAIAYRSPTVIVDAITGTGLIRPLDARAAAAVRAMNLAGRPIIAIDVPSGLDCDTGEPLGEACIRAKRTITFVAEKLGFANSRSHEFTGGDIVVGDIGCPLEVVARVCNP